MHSQKYIDEQFELNKDLIHYILHKYKIKNDSDLYQDGYQAGSIGLIKAIETYRPDLGKFGTHAYFIIRKEIQDVMSRLPTVYLGRYRTMLRNYGKKLTLSLNHPYPSQDDDGPLYWIDLLKAAEQGDDDPFTDEQWKMALHGISRAKLTKNQKYLIKEWMAGKSKRLKKRLEHVQGAVVNDCITKIRKAIYRRYKVRIH